MKKKQPVFRLEPAPTQKPKPCNRGCCWTPFGCGLRKRCECHVKDFVRVWYPTPDKKENKDDN
jgi:hypothetical protein